MIGTCERREGRAAGRTCEDMATAACTYVGGGLSVLPAYRDRKCPALGTWKRYQTRLPTKTEIRAWFANRHDALCLVTGAVSGNLEMIDFDFAGELFEPWRDAVEAEVPGLAARLYLERTQSSGWHVAYRHEDAPEGNAVLARRKRPVAEDEIVRDDTGRECVVLHGKRYPVMVDADGTKHALITLIETRGEGGVFLCTPTPGYDAVQGDLCDPPALTAEERHILLRTARQLNEYAAPVINGPTTNHPPTARRGGSSSGFRDAAAR